MWKLTFGALLSTLASMVDTLPQVSVLGHQVPPWGALASGITQVDNYVLEAIGAGITQTEKGLHAVLGAMTWLLQQMADEIAGLAEDVTGAFTQLIHHTIPTAIHAVTDPIWRELGAIEQRFTAALAQPAQVINRTTDVIAPGLRALEGKVNSLEAKVAALGATASSAVAAAPSVITLPSPVAIPGDITKGLDSLWKRVKEFGRVLTPAGIAGLVAGAVLSTLGLSWLKCRNVEKTAKQVCRTNVDVLEGLLSGLLALFGTFSLVEFAKYLEPVVGDIGTGVTHFWRADVQGAGRDRQVGSPSLD